MELKIYQQKSLDKISEFLKDLEKEKPEFAFMHLTKQPYKDEFFGDWRWENTSRMSFGYSNNGFVLEGEDGSWNSDVVCPF
jgi:hypothetical protein